jgi:hypothetical protein
MDVSVEIHCELCGSANYSIGAGAGDDAPIQCNDCGADQGTLGELKDALAQQALDQSAESLRGRLGDVPTTH